MADYVSTCRLGWVSKECVWCRLDLVRDNDCDVIDLGDPYQLVHYAVEALLSVCKRSPAGKLGAVERDDAVDYYHLGLKVVDVLAHRLDYQLKMAAIVCLAYRYSFQGLFRVQTPCPCYLIDSFRSERAFCVDKYHPAAKPCLF